MDLASRMRAAIDATGRTQASIAAQSEVPEETISRIVTGETKNPHLVTLTRLAATLNVSVGWLLGERMAPFTDTEARVLASAMEILRYRIGGATVDARELPNVAALDRRHEVPREYAVRGAKLVFRALGDSMRELGIADRDRLFVREVRDLRRAIDHVVVCRVSSAMFVKRLAVEGGRILLLSANDRYDPIVIDDKVDDFAVVGIVIGKTGDV